MRSNKILGIVFPNVQDDLMGELTEHRSMGSVPFCGRYRLIDFSLSNLVNAGISTVGIVTKANYQSLMDHIGTGKAWDLFLPPYSNNDAKIYKGHLDGLAGAMHFLKSSKLRYVVLCDADVISNFDLSDMINKHIESGADATIAYKRGKMPSNHHDVMAFTLDGDKITDIAFGAPNLDDCCFSLDVTVMSREKLIEIVQYGYEHNLTSLARDIFQKAYNDLDMRGYEVKSYAAVMDSPESYARITAEVLESAEIRNELFKSGRPVFTKIRDDMPTLYGLDSQVRNSLIADGCVIEGTVKNSVLFRGVKVLKGAVVENSIIMQDSVVMENSEVQYVTSDKKVTVEAGKTLRGTSVYPIYVRKGARV